MHVLFEMDLLSNNHWDIITFLSHEIPNLYRGKKSQFVSTVDGRNPANHLAYINPCKEWDKLPTSSG